MTNGDGRDRELNFGPRDDSKDDSTEAPRDGADGNEPESGPLGDDAIQLASIASKVTADMNQVVGRLQEILDGFKETVEAADYAGDREIGQSLGGIMSSVEEVRAQMENIAAYATAMSATRLARMAEALRTDLKGFLRKKND